GRVALRIRGRAQGLSRVDLTDAPDANPSLCTGLSIGAEASDLTRVVFVAQDGLADAFHAGEAWASLLLATRILRGAGTTLLPFHGAVRCRCFVLGEIAASRDQANGQHERSRSHEAICPPSSVPPALHFHRELDTPKYFLVNHPRWTRAAHPTRTRVRTARYYF